MVVTQTTSAPPVVDQAIDYAEELPHSTKLLILGAVLLSLFLAALDQTIVATALPAIVRDFNGIDLLSWVSTGYLLASTAMVPIYGKLSDMYGRKPILIASTVLGFLTALPLFWVMHHPSLALLGQFGLMLVVSPFIGAFPALLVESAPPRVRCTAVGLGYNTCLALSGGTAPLVATWLVERTGNELSPAFVVMAAAAVSFTALLWTKETHHKPMQMASAPSRA